MTSVVSVVAQERLALFESADHLEGITVNIDLFPDGVFVEEEPLDDIGADHRHVAAVYVVDIREQAAILQDRVGDAEVFSRIAL